MTSQTPPPLPTWYQEYSTLFRSGAAHSFLLCGDIHGTALRGASQLRFLQSILTTSERDIVLYYHRAVGITFPLESMREKAQALLESAQTRLPLERDPLNVALTASGVLSSGGSGDPFTAARRPRDVLALLEQLLRHPDALGRLAVILDGVDLICPATSKATMSEERLALLATLQYWGNDVQLARQDNPIFQLARRLSEVHPDLCDSDNGYKVIKLPLPDERTRLAYLTWYLEHRTEREDPIMLRDLSVEDLARNTAGLNLRQVEDLLLLGAVVEHAEQGPVGVSRRLVKSRKDAIIQQQHSEIALMLDPLPDGFASLGGMQHLVEWTRAEVIAPLREGRLRDVPKGILLVGPPGTGKTRYAEAVAGELGFSAVALRMDNILGGIVGTSEHNLKQFFAFARALAPVLIFIDEIDQSDLARRGNTSGNPVAANLFGALLQFLGDETLRGRVIVVGASNHPEQLDTALLRFGRMDAIIPVLCPDEPARRDILAVQARLQQVLLTPEAQHLLAAQTEKYSAADLAALITEARRAARQAGRNMISVQDAQVALDHIRPATLALVDTYTRCAIDACNNVRLLPPEHAALLRNRTALRTHRQQDLTQEPRTSRTL